jgi:hypothetical protein
MTSMCVCEENYRTASGNVFNEVVKPRCKGFIQPFGDRQTNEGMKVSAIHSFTLKITTGGMPIPEAYMEHSRAVVTP